MMAAGLRELAAELLLAASGRRRRRHLLIVLDQLEEMLTQASATSRGTFAELLRPALTGPVRVVATIRTDSLDQLLSAPELAGLPTRTFSLRPLPQESLPMVIQGPARLAGIGVDDELVSRVVADTESGEALPLLAFTLSELAAGVGRGGQLSTRRYEELGGVQGGQADAALAAACAATGRGPDDVIAGLLRLVTVDERGEPTRWRIRRDELPELVRTELDVFVASRLLTTDADESGNVLIGVAHEAFLSAWPPLAEAIKIAASGLRARRGVEQAADEWAENDRPQRRLWGGDQLAAAVAATGARLRRAAGSGWRRRLPGWLPLGDRVLATDHVELSPRAREFLGASIRRDRRRRRLSTTILSGLLALAVTAAGIAFAQQQQALQQQRIATARELTTEADALRDSQPRVSMLLGLEATRLDPSDETRAALMATLAQTHYAGMLSGHARFVRAVAYSPDGHTLATASDDRSAILWEFSDRSHPARLATLSGHTEVVSAVAFSPDGHTLATASLDYTAILWDVREPLALSRDAHMLACALAKPNLSRPEWDRYIPGLPYERICP